MLFFLILFARFTLFCKVVDGEMRDVAKKEVELKFKMYVRDEISEREEEFFWTKELLGHLECLLNTIYFYNKTSLDFK